MTAAYREPLPTAGEWMAREGDVLNADRPFGIVVPLSEAAHVEIDGEPGGGRTEVIAEVCCSPDPGQAYADALLMANAKRMRESLMALLEWQARLGEFEAPEWRLAAKVVRSTFPKKAVVKRLRAGSKVRKPH